MNQSGQLSSPAEDDVLEEVADRAEWVAARRRRFRAALALAGTTAREFAKALGVHQSHLQQVLGRRRGSVRVNEAIEQLIAAHPGVSHGG